MVNFLTLPRNCLKIYDHLYTSLLINISGRRRHFSFDQMSRLVMICRAQVRECPPIEFEWKYWDHWPSSKLRKCMLECCFWCDGMAGTIRIPFTSTYKCWDRYFRNYSLNFLWLFMKTPCLTPILSTLFWIMRHIPFIPMSQNYISQDIEEKSALLNILAWQGNE